MKSLYESILSSTKSGVPVIIKKWCEENLDFGNANGITRPSTFVIQNDRRITNAPKLNLNLTNVNEKIPDYIKFGEMTESFFVGTALKYMTKEQLPPKVKLLYIGGQTETIPSFKMECTQGLYINDYPQDLKHIEPIYIECHSTNGGHRKPIINLGFTQIKLEDLKNIHVTGDIYELDIKKTPAAQEIHKTVKNMEKEAERKGYFSDLNPVPPFEEYLDEIFNSQDWPGLRYIYLSDRKILEHNPRTKHWDLN